MSKASTLKSSLLAAILSYASLSEASPRQESGKALQDLADTLVWTSLEQCAATYNLISNQLSKTQAAIGQARTSAPWDNYLILFIDKHLNSKFSSLSEEIQYLRNRCIATDYDGSSSSLERPSRLQQMLQEWRSTILWAREAILNNYQPRTEQVLMSETLVPPRTPEPLQKFRDCADVYCQEMVIVPKGSFIMGGTNEEAISEGVNATVASWERPQHMVTIQKPFAIATTEVTLGAFKEFIRETNYALPQGCTSLNAPSDPATGLATLAFIEDYNYENPGFSQDNDHPVVCVRREDARAYANWISRKTGKNYRLPTEAEWEYTTRAGTQTIYFWGDDKNEACLYANVYDHSSDAENLYGYQRFECSDSFPYTAPVASFLPNNFGVYDLLANAREWVDDCWHYSYQSAPTDGSRWGSENNGLCRFGVLRGGAWAYNTFNVRVAYRNAYFSSQARASMWSFRLAREI